MDSSQTNEPHSPAQKGRPDSRSNRRTHHRREHLRLPRIKKNRPGSSPGIDLSELQTLPAGVEEVPIFCIDYSPEKVEMREITRVETFLAEPRPDWVRVRWINVNGLSNPQVIHAMARHFQLHPLAVEDMFHRPQRPKMENFIREPKEGGQLFLIARMLYLLEDRLQNEQISIFVERHTVLTFQERPGDVWSPIRERIQRNGSRLRNFDVSFLLYALLDAIVDHCYPILEHYGNRLEELEAVILQNAPRNAIQEIHSLKRELLLARRTIWPMREMVHALYQESPELITESTRTYLRDVYDHAVQILDLIETYREVATGLTETYMTVQGQRLNEVMKVLTIIATIFIPITFLAGVYGMNFHYIPELDWRWAYPVFWGLCLIIAAGMVWWFKRRGWL